MKFRPQISQLLLGPSGGGTSGQLSPSQGEHMKMEESYLDRNWVMKRCMEESECAETVFQRFTLPTSCDLNKSEAPGIVLP